MHVLAQIASAAPVIATQDSGVSWGALVAILGVIATVGAAALSVFYSFFKTMSSDLNNLLSAQNVQFTAMFERVDAKITKVEEDSRQSRKDLFDTQMATREKHSDRITAVETTVQLISRGASGYSGGGQK